MGRIYQQCSIAPRCTPTWPPLPLGLHSMSMLFCLSGFLISRWGWRGEISLPTDPGTGQTVVMGISACGETITFLLEGGGVSVLHGERNQGMFMQWPVLLPENGREKR